MGCPPEQDGPAVTGVDRQQPLALEAPLRKRLVGPEALMGVVSRADVLKVFLRPDMEIRREVVEDVIIRTLWMDPVSVEVRAVEGVVSLTGEVDRRSDIPILVRLVGAVDGVVGVRESLSFRFDDLRADSRLAIPGP